MSFFNRAAGVSSTGTFRSSFMLFSAGRSPLGGFVGFFTPESELGFLSGRTGGVSGGVAVRGRRVRIKLNPLWPTQRTSSLASLQISLAE